MAISTLSLLSHDLRLARRQLKFASARHRIMVLTMVGLIVVILHIVGYVFAPNMIKLRDHDSALTISVLLSGIFSLYMSKALSSIIESMRDKGDLELLLSSPLPPRVALRARLLAIAVEAGFLPCVAAFPIVNGMGLRGEIGWFGTYPVFISLAVIASVLAGFGFLGLLALVGAARARLAGRVIATILGAAAFLITQSTLIFPPAWRQAVWRVATAHGFAGGGLWLPARAVLGDGKAILLIAAIAVGSLLLLTRWFEGWYGTGMMAILAADRGGRASHTMRFGGSVRQVLMTKERRHFLRQPGLVIQIAYQFVFILPAAIVLMHLRDQGGDFAMIFMSVLMTGRIASVFLSIITRKDMAAELVMTAPIAMAPVHQVKSAVLMAAILTMTLPLLALIGWQQPHVLPVVVIVMIGSLLTRFRLELRRPRQQIRAGSLHGRVQLPGGMLVGALTDIGWAIVGIIVLSL